MAHPAWRNGNRLTRDTTMTRHYATTELLTADAAVAKALYLAGWLEGSLGARLSLELDTSG